MMRYTNIVRDNSQGRLPQGWPRKGIYPSPYEAANGNPGPIRVSPPVRIPGTGNSMPPPVGVPLPISPPRRSIRTPFPIFNLSGLGDDAANQATLINLGFSAAQASQVIQAHASGALSDDGYNQILSGNIAPEDLQDYLDTDPGATATPPFVISPPAQGALPTQAAGVPTGAVVTYHAQLPFSLSTSVSSLVSQAIQSQAPGHGLSVLSIGGSDVGQPFGPKTFQLSGSFPITVQLQVTGSGFAVASDVASIINGIIYSAIQQMPTAGNASVTQLPGAASSGQNPGATFNWNTWLQQNTSTLVVVVVLLALGPSLIKKF
jgi:hypothetical protein